MTITSTSAFSAGRTLTFNTGDANRLIQATTGDLAFGGAFTTGGAVPISAFGATLVDDAAASDARTTLGLGTAATQNTGTSGATIPLLNTINTWSALQAFYSTAVAAQPLQIIGEESGAAVGPILPIFRWSATPAAMDQIGALFFYGRNSAAADVGYTQITTVITDPTAASEDAVVDFLTYVACTSASRMTIGAGVMI